MDRRNVLHMNTNTALRTARLGNGNAIHLVDADGILCNRWGTVNGVWKAPRCRRRRGSHLQAVQETRRVTGRRRLRWDEPAPADLFNHLDMEGAMPIPRHQAVATLWGDRWRADCGQCGWISRPQVNEERAKASATRHNTNASKEDDAISLRLWGPRNT
jgi:hypothetical protein